MIQDFYRPPETIIPIYMRIYFRVIFPRIIYAHFYKRYSKIFSGFKLKK